MAKKLTVYIFCALLLVFAVIVFIGYGKNPSNSENELVESTSSSENELVESTSSSENELVESTSSSELEMPKLTFNTLSVDGTNVYGKVPNQTETFSFKNEITVEEGCDYVVSLDEFGLNQVQTEEVSLNVGDNYFFVTESVNGEIEKTYSVTIRRRTIYTVKFYNVKFYNEDEMLFDTQNVEEDGFLTVPQNTPERSGYDFIDWDFDFESPVVSDLIITPNWESIFDVIQGSIYGLTEYGQTLSEIVVPDYIDFKPITKINSVAFSGSYNLKSVKISEGITTIGNGAFSDCFYLRSIEIPNSVDTVGYAAFKNCEKLTYNVKDGLNYLGNDENQYLYLAGPVLKTVMSINVDAGCKIIGTSAFENCRLLKNVEISGVITCIEAYAFKGCPIEHAIIPAHLTDDIPKDNLITVKINSAENIVDYAFYNCDTLISAELGDSVTRIGYNAFIGCKNLTSVKIGSGVTQIGPSAFFACFNLTEITVSENNQNYCSVDNSLYSKDKTVFCAYAPGNGSELKILNGVTTIVKNALQQCNKLTSVEIPNSVITIEEEAFSGCENLTSVKMGDGVKTIGAKAFYDCYKLTSIKAKGIVTVGDFSFSECKSLTSVELGDNIVTIGTQAFRLCENLISLSIGNGIVTIGDGAIYGCNNLKYNVKDNLAYIGNESNPYLCLVDVYSNTITTAVVDERCKVIGGGDVFQCTPNLTTVIISDSVMYINPYSFWDCSSLKYVIFSENSTWCIAGKDADLENRTGGTEIDVTNDFANAVYLKTSYYLYYWYRSN